MRGVKQPAMDRFVERIEVGDGCWLWIGARNANGYGTFNPENTYRRPDTGARQCRTCAQGRSQARRAGSPDLRRAHAARTATTTPKETSR